VIGSGAQNCAFRRRGVVFSIRVRKAARAAVTVFRNIFDSPEEAHAGSNLHGLSASKKGGLHVHGAFGLD
jgi:hypothetical protein